MAGAAKTDLYRLHKDEYAAGREPQVVETKPARYLVIEGTGKPGGEVFQDRIGALYGVAYTVKMTRKFEGQGEQKSLWVPSKYDAVSIKSGAKACDFKGETCSVTPRCGGFYVHLLQAVSNYVFWECPPTPCNGG